MTSSFNLASECFPVGSIVHDGCFSYLDEAGASEPGSLVYCQTLHFLELAAANPNVSAIITTHQLSREPIPASKAVIAADDPRLDFFGLYVSFCEAGLNRPSLDFGIGNGCRIHPTAVVSPRSRIGNRVEIGPNVVVEDWVDVMDDVYIGPNAVIGAEGLITLRRPDGSLLVVRHAGGVVIAQGTQILAGAIVAKSLFRSSTRIGRNCQIGILANVGHGAVIGDGCVISGNTVIAGRTKLGPKVWVGASVSIAQGLEVGEGAQLKMGSVVIGNVGCGQVVSGNFAVTHAASLRNFFKIRSYEKR